MKFVRFGGGRTGLVVDAGGLAVLDVAASLPALSGHDAAAARLIGAVLPHGARDWRPMIGQWDDLRHAFAALQAMPAGDMAIRPYDSVSLEPPLAAPDVHVYSLGSNTTEHIVRAFKVMKNLDITHAQARKAKDDGVPPAGFTVFPATIAGPDALVTPPKGTQKFDYEAECAVYVKRGGRDLHHVSLWGYTAFNDLGVRDPFLKLAPEAPWAPFSLNLPKTFDTGTTCGPWVAVDEAPDLAELRCVLTVNGEKRQDWSLSEMIYGFEETLCYISSYVTLRPGDMLSSGTSVGVAMEGGVDGPHWLKPGDVIELTLDGMAPLRNTVGAW